MRLWDKVICSSRCKYAVMVSALVSQFLRACFLAGSVPLLPIYYEDRYQERTISSTIGSVQISVTYILVFPAMLLCQKIGPRIVKMTGSLLVVAGMLGTAFTTEAWQALITNGVVTGVGATCLLASGYAVVTIHFPRPQLAPYIAMSIFSSVGSLASPKLLGFVFTTVGFKNGLAFCSGMMALCFFAGMFYFPKAFRVESEDLVPDPTTKPSSSAPKYSMKVKGRKEGIFILEAAGTCRLQKELPKLRSWMKQESISKTAIDPIGLKDATAPGWNPCSGTSRGNFLQVNTLSAILNMLGSHSEQNQHYEQQGVVEDKLDEKESSDDSASFPERSLRDFLTDIHGSSIADLIKSNPAEKCYGKVKQLFKKPAAVNFLLGELVTYASYVAFTANLADFARHEILLPDDDYTFALLLNGISLLTTQVIYIIISRFCAMGSTLLHTIASLGLASVWFVLLSVSSDPGMFNVLMILNGFFTAVYQCSVHGCCLETTSVELASLMHAASMMCNGFGALMGSYGISYLQVEVNIKSGIYVAGGLMVLGALSLLPIGVRYMKTPKTYVSFEGRQRVRSIGYIPQTA